MSGSRVPSVAGTSLSRRVRSCITIPRLRGCSLQAGSSLFCTATGAAGGELWTGRVLGLPGERLEIAGGNLYVNDGEIIVKPLSVQRNLWVPFAIEECEGRVFGRGFQPTTEGWVLKDGVARVASRKRTYLGFSPSADRRAFAGLAGITDLSVESGPASFVCPVCKLPFRPLPGCFTLERDVKDIPAYFGICSGCGARFCAHCGKPHSGPPVGASGKGHCGRCGNPAEERDIPRFPVFRISGGENAVYDIRVDFSLSAQSLTGEFALEYNYHDSAIALVFKGEKTLLRTARAGKSEESAIPKLLMLNTPVNVSFQCYDGQIRVTLDEIEAQMKLDLNLSNRPAFRLAFAAEGGAYLLDRIRIYRDQFYSGSEGLFSLGSHSVVKIPSDSCFLINDIGADIRDSRSWGCVLSEDIVGSPLMTLWPLSLRR
jgi:hypothetical protein